MSYQSQQLRKALPGTLTDLCAATHMSVMDVLYYIAQERASGTRIVAINSGIGIPTIFTLDDSAQPEASSRHAASNRQ